MQTNLSAKTSPSGGLSSGSQITCVRIVSLSQEKAMPKVGFISLGCPKNLVDSEVMMGILARSGYELTPRAEYAAVLVANTCSFIDAAHPKTVDTDLHVAVDI